MSNVPTQAEMVARARALAPVLAARAEACEKARRVPDETVADFLDAGFHRAVQPARYGGYEMGWGVLAETAAAFGAGCASQGWVLTVYGDHAQMVSIFPGEAQDEVWRDDPKTLTATSFAPMGKARAERGGAVVTGRWGFSSGIDHARWLIAGAMLDGRFVYVMVPKSQVEVIDDWHVAGLAGTGSKSFAMEDVFVPPHRIILESAANDGTAPGTRINTAPLYRYPRKGAGVALAAVPVGAASGMLADFAALCRDRTKRGRRAAAGAMDALRVAEGESDMAAAKALLAQTARDVEARLARGEALDIEARTISRRNPAYAVMLAARTVDRLMASAGGNSIYRTNRLQRAFRDVHAAAAHIGFSWEMAAGPYGQWALGYDLEEGTY
jgi:3-hydroxy-9,10-secoandrosta-1,3,5(10)-triene-9,17-dione monooxygenase